jgi:hypothetical protein
MLTWRDIILVAAAVALVVFLALVAQAIWG